MTKHFPAFRLTKYLPYEIVCFVLIIAAAYLGTIDHPFHFDDRENISNKSFIQISKLSFDELKKAGFESTNRNRPVANISFALNYYFHGLDVTGYHAVNIIVHLFAGILLYFFIRETLSVPAIKDKFGEPNYIAFFTALIWMVHPLHTQSVTYIVQRMNSMAAMFFIMTLFFYVKARQTPESLKKILFFTISFIASLLAFGSKENTATLPLFILLYEWYFFKDLNLKISKKQTIWIAVLACLFGFVLYFFLGNSPLSRLFPDYSGRPFTMAQRLLTQPRVVLHYISLLFYPDPGRLNLDYNFPLSYSLLSPPTTLIAILVITGMLGLAIYTARKNRLYSFCILWFIGNLVIESSTIPLEIIFEHRTYLPSMMAVFFFVILFHKLVKNKKMLVVCLVSLGLLFSYWTHTRNKVWKDELTLWTDNQKKSPNKARTNLYLGLIYSDKGRVDEAIPVLQKALFLYMQETELQRNVNHRNTAFYLAALGTAYMKKGEYPKAIRFFKKALKESPYDESIHYDLGNCYLRTWRLQRAINHFSLALELSQYHNARVSMQVKVEEIRDSLEKAKLLLKSKKERETILKQGS